MLCVIGVVVNYNTISQASIFFNNKPGTPGRSKIEGLFVEIDSRSFCCTNFDMRLNVFLLLGILFGALHPIDAAMVNRPASAVVQPDIVAKLSYRSFSGVVQTISHGTIRLRDDVLGDIKVVVTDATSISTHMHPTTAQSIRSGTRLHGYANFRGGYYFAKVITIDLA